MEVRYDTIQYDTINLRLVYCQSFVFEIEVQLGCLRHQCSINTLDLLELPKKSFCRHGRPTCDHNVKRQQYGSHRLLHCSWLCLLWINWNYDYLSNLSPSLSLSLSHTHFLSQFAIPVIGEILFSFPMSSITYPFKVNEYYQYMQQRQFLIN